MELRVRSINPGRATSELEQRVIRRALQRVAQMAAQRRVRLRLEEVEVVMPFPIERVADGYYTVDGAAQVLTERIWRALAPQLSPSTAPTRTKGVKPAGSSLEVVRQHLGEDPDELYWRDPHRFLANLALFRDQLTPEQLQALDLRLMGQRFIDRVHYQEALAKGDPQPHHRYGESAWQAWSSAARQVEYDARQRRPLSHAMVQNWHRLAAVPAAGVQGTPGTYKDLVNMPGGQVLQGMGHLLLPEEAEVVRENPDLIVQDLSWFTPPDDVTMKRRGVPAQQVVTMGIQYAPPEAVQERLERLFGWIEAASVAGMDPIQIAATAQRRFISIHPFLDGNGRVSRLLMDYVLLLHGLPPALLEDPNLDWMVGEGAWTQHVREGVLRHYEEVRAAVRHELAA